MKPSHCISPFISMQWFESCRVDKNTITSDDFGLIWYKWVRSPGKIIAECCSIAIAQLLYLYDLTDWKLKCPSFQNAQRQNAHGNILPKDFMPKLTYCPRRHFAKRFYSQDDNLPIYFRVF